MAERAASPAGWVALGHVVRAHGVRGAVLVEPYTDDPLAVLAHGARLELLSPDGGTRRPADPLSGRPAARGLIVTLGRAADRAAAEALKGWRLGLDRRFLPPAGDDEIYQADLEGLTVVTPDGWILGRVDGLMEIGAGLILAVSPPGEPGRELLLPFQEEFIVSLETAGGRLVYDPPPGLLDL